ncbi:hypothetical protein [Nocardioides aquiterrae]|uniref:hypothetical protein n=1 Tax=Nocardioides aquiterrae TaxID=203799 RepID=UPI0031D90623
MKHLVRLPRLLSGRRLRAGGGALPGETVVGLEPVRGQDGRIDIDATLARARDDSIATGVTGRLLEQRLAFYRQALERLAARDTGAPPGGDEV